MSDVIKLIVYAVGNYCVKTFVQPLLIEINFMIAQGMFSTYSLHTEGISHIFIRFDDL